MKDTSSRNFNFIFTTWWFVINAIKKTKFVGHRTVWVMLKCLSDGEMTVGGVKS